MGLNFELKIMFVRFNKIDYITSRTVPTNHVAMLICLNITSYDACRHIGSLSHLYLTTIA